MRRGWIVCFTLGVFGGPSHAGRIASDGELVPLATRVFHDRCPKRLLGDERFPFREAEIACAAFVAGALHAHTKVHGSTRTIRLALDGMVRVALSPTAMEPFASTGWSRVNGRRMPRSVLYRGWLAYIFAMREGVSPGRIQSATYHALVRGLARDLGDRYVPSFGGAIYPCDHAPAAAALTLYGARFSDPEIAEVGASLRNRLQKLLDAGFPTRVTKRGRVSGPERGTPHAFVAAFMVEADPALARRFAIHLYEHFCVDRGFVAGCTETTGGDGPVDSASGPSIAGLAVGTTALALAASAAAPDHPLVPSLWRTAAVV
ncbi:MAG: hypothetical protein AAF658_03180, partial [Myxococcota bacterium]